MNGWPTFLQSEDPMNAEKIGSLLNDSAGLRPVSDRPFSSFRHSLRTTRFLSTIDELLEKEGAETEF